MTTIHDATTKGDIEAVKAILDRYPHCIDAIDTNTEQTPLHIAAQHGHDEIVEVLIEKGSRAFSMTDNFGQTPLFTALNYGNDIIASFLLTPESSVINIPTKRGWTSMHAVVYHSNGTFLIEKFMRIGCITIDATDRYGSTPLHYAAICGNTEAIKTLIRLGSQSIGCKDNEGMTPLDEAYKANESRAVRLLYVLEGLQHTAEYTTDITEEERYDVRHSVYFHQSLSARLLFANDRLRHLRQNSKIKH